MIRQIAPDISNRDLYSSAHQLPAKKEVKETSPVVKEVVKEVRVEVPVPYEVIKVAHIDRELLREIILEVLAERPNRVNQFFNRIFHRQKVKKDGN